MVILRDATILYKGYDPEDLKPKSNKRICVSCDICGRVRYINKSAYRDICHPCSLIGNKQALGMKHTDETKKILSNSNIGNKNSMYGIHRFGKNNPNWKGGYDKKRSYLIPKNQCIKLNTYFKSSNAHHIMSGVIIFMPKNLHESIRHRMTTKKNMKEINKIAMDYLVGEY